MINPLFNDFYNKIPMMNKMNNHNLNHRKPNNKKKLNKFLEMIANT